MQIRLLVLGLALLAGCGGSSGSSSSNATFSPPAPPPPGSPPPGSPPGALPGPTPGTPPSPPPSVPPGTRPDSGAPGSWGNRFLSAATYTSLLVTVDWVATPPRQAALDLLRQRLSERCNKPGGIAVTLGKQVASSRSVYSVQDIVNLENATRTIYASGSQAVLYVIYLDGHSDQDGPNGNVLGLAYTGTSLAIFPETIASSATLLVPASEIEQAVLVHEAGHALGLVGIGAPVTSGHQDAAHGAHCNVQGCVMFFQIDSSNVIQLVQNLGQLPKDFDAACKSDLAANGGR